MSKINKIPTVIIFNIAETFANFLEKSSDPQKREELINGEAYLGDRALLWGGDPKLAIVSYPIAHSEIIKNRLNYPQTTYRYPQHTTNQLSLDIIRDPGLLEAISNYAGENRSLQIIPYATTPEFLSLITILRENYQLSVETPESPNHDHLWIRDLVDTKAGFRQLVSQWLPDADRFLPPGFICYDSKQAADAAFWFYQRGKACLVKANTGENGIGIFIIRPDIPITLEEINKKIEDDTYYTDDLIVVEECIPATKQNSPSLELFVPHPKRGKPEITYLSKQLFIEFGDFCGIEVSKNLQQEKWFPDLERCGILIAHKLQDLGYVGHFDLDCIISDDEKLYLLEINSRRTGGTHVHDLAYHIIGPDYIDNTSLLSFEAMDSGRINSADELINLLAEFLYPINKEHIGLVITVTTTLKYHRFGCLTIAPTPGEALILQKQIAQKISEHSR